MASIFFYTVLGVIIALKTLDFTSIENAATYVNNAIIDDSKAIDLFDLNYRFAIEAIDSKVGEVQVW